MNPHTAMTCPRLLARSVATPRPRSVLRDGWITASLSSSDSAAGPAGVTSPESVTSRISMPCPARWAPIEATALTAASNGDPGPEPRYARRRVSMSSSARLCHCCSSRRTISSPYRAVDRQCTRRSSSPSR